LFKDAVFFPKGQDFFFQFGEIDLGVYGLIHVVLLGRCKLS
jgi:hypothetical protein